MLGGQIEGRLFEIKIPQGDLSGLDLPGEDKTVDSLFFGHHGSGGASHDCGLSLNGLVVHGAIPKDQKMLILLMLEKIEDTLFFEKARNEVQVRFTVLDTEFSRLWLIL